MKKDGFRANACCAILVLLAFALIYARSLTFVYVEGDDASTIAYHSLGRNLQLQPPYSPYQSMLDAVLGMFPPRENVVRQTAMILTAVSAPLFFYFMMLLAFDWCNDVRRCSKWILVVVMLFAVPEIFYLAMVLTPSLIAMTIILGSHLIIRHATAHTANPDWRKLAASLILFGIGAAFRWDTVSYGATIVADLFFRSGNQREHPPVAKHRLLLSVGWGILAGLSWLIVLIFNGWSPEAVLSAILTQSPVENFDWKLGLARAQPFFTPGFAFLGAFGFYVLVRRKQPLAVVSVVALFAIARFVLYGVPKWFITATPSWVACAVYGFCVISQWPKLRYVTLCLLVIPWLFGVRWLLGGTAWGPGFELQPYHRIAKRGSMPSATFAAGMAIPTPEGPRPFFGHGWVLLGEWKRFVNDYASEQEIAVLKAIDAELPLLLDEQGQGWFVNILLSLNYVTVDSERRTVGNNSIIERRWVGPDGGHVRLLKFIHPDDLFDAGAIDHLRSISDNLVVICGF